MIYTFNVSEDERGKTLRNFLIFDCGLSRKKVTQAGHSAKILVGGCPRFLDYRVDLNERVEVHLQDPEESNIIPEHIELQKIYEDEDILIIDKPPNLVVHPTSGYLTGTLANGIAYYWAQKGLNQPIRIINRLDRDTSGLVLIAANEIAGHFLNQDFESGAGQKKYIALIEGNIIPPKGTINAPIGRQEGSIILRQVTAQGKVAITHYQTLEQFPEASLVEIILETGRTHQIRVHFAHQGHPLVGDSLYGPEMQPILSRHGLHCAELTFTHPRTKKILTFQSSLPQDIQEAIGRFSQKVIKG